MIVLKRVTRRGPVRDDFRFSHRLCCRRWIGDEPVDASESTPAPPGPN